MFQNRHLILNVLFLPLAALLLVGCSDGSIPVTGSIAFNGEKVKGGSISFAPVGKEGESASRSAEGPVNADGSFTVERVAPGKNRVTYHAPGAGDPNTPVELKEGETVPVSPYVGLVPENPEVDIQPKTPVNLTLKKSS